MKQEPTLRIPAFTAYLEPQDYKPLSINNALVWYGELKATGSLQLSVERKGMENGPVRWNFSVERVSEDTGVRKVKVGPLEGGEVISVGAGAKSESGHELLLSRELTIRKPGYYRFRVMGEFPSPVETLILSGPACKDAHFNLKERKNCASVHLAYPLDKETKAEWFYNEITVRTEPLYSYYMACGFARGYFGIQVNSPAERRIIFSIWDSGNEGVDRSKVADEDQVKLLAKGDRVVASGFGNEGTGGHSHMVYPWKRDTTYKFLVHAEPVQIGKGKQTIYSGYFWFPEKRTWGLIARFRAPKDGNYLSGLYSFNENFGGDNGQLLRLAEFGPSWVRSSDNKWQELESASFSCDATGRAKDRLDFAAGVAKSGRWYLSNGGFVKNGIAYKDPLPPRKLHGKPPELLPKSG